MAMKLSTGKVAFPIEFDNGDKDCIYFNPNDPNLAVRFTEFQDKVNERLKEFEDDVLSLKEVNELCHKINVEADDMLSSVFPNMQSAIVTIRSSKGEFVKRVDFPKGEPENPLDEMEFKERYQDLMSFAGVQRNVYTEVYAIMNNLETKVSNLIKNI